MATAFYGAIVLAPVQAGQPVQVEKFDSTDVANAYFTWANNGGETWIQAKRKCYLVDIGLNITTAGTTDELKLWINNQDTGIRFPQALAFPNLDTRMFNKAPVPLNAGDRIQIQAVT